MGLQKHGFGGVFGLIIGVLLIALFNLFQGGGSRDNATEISYSAFVRDIDAK